MSAPTPNDLKTDLQTLARSVGFDLCQVACCSPPAHTAEFRDWLREGAAGEMGYMQRGEDKRCDPQQILPGARSIIVLALNYWQGKPEWRKFSTCDVQTRNLKSCATKEAGATGRIARYAWGK